MKTPICDFVTSYMGQQTVRMHMPGHKGRTLLGPEAMDITEISGADELFHARGVIRESEENAAALFGAARTLYSTEGSSLCIRAMLHLALLRGRTLGLPERILAGRNAHRTLMTAAALLDLEVDWIMPDPDQGLLACPVSPEKVARRLREKSYLAVFLTSPDYPGHMQPVREIASACAAFGTPLLVDNAHGAYLRFLPENMHPLTLGAAMCCDSAHKTLPCLTGGAYLHIAGHAPEGWAEQAEAAMSLFASTSPSYLILQSLDCVNAELAGSFPACLADTVNRLDDLKERLRAGGWQLTGNEPMKLSLASKAYGYPGHELAEELRRRKIEPEFSDQDTVTLMPSPATTEEEWVRLRVALESIPPRAPIRETPPAAPRLERVCSIRDAMLSPRQTVAVGEAGGRILADAAAGCPPAVPIAIAGERLNDEAIAAFRYYGIQNCAVIAENRHENCRNGKT